MARFGAILMATLLLLAAACSDTGSGSDVDPVDVSDRITGPEVDPDDYSTAYQLATIAGNPSLEDEFQQVIDCIMATGIQGAETEEQVGDTLYASWESSSQEVTLLEWGQILCAG